MYKYFQCTRLLPDEVKFIRAEGLKPASYELFCAKVKTARGDLPGLWAQAAQTYFRNPQNVIATFFDDQADLQKKTIVGVYFEQWGGQKMLKEMLAPKDSQVLVGLVENSIDEERKPKPYIIVVELEKELERLNVPPGQPSQRFTRETVTPDQLRVISRTDADFLELTQAA